MASKSDLKRESRAAKAALRAAAEGKTSRGIHLSASQRKTATASADRAMARAGLAFDKKLADEKAGITRRDNEVR